MRTTGRATHIAPRGVSIWLEARLYGNEEQHWTHSSKQDGESFNGYEEENGGKEEDERGPQIQSRGQRVC
jgi:hypothetical protein